MGKNVYIKSVYLSLWFFDVVDCSKIWNVMALRITKDMDIMYFSSDEEFTDFCIAPYAEVKETSDGTLCVEGRLYWMYRRGLFVHYPWWRFEGLW